METGFKVISCLPALSSYPTYKEWKLTIIRKLNPISTRSYPTYKEWKHIVKLLWFIESLGSYPTYKEWKHKVESIFGAYLKRSYPTYKEWKLFILVPRNIPFVVLILPIRNGNLNTLNHG